MTDLEPDLSHDSPPSEPPAVPVGRLAGIDYGTVRIGIALTNHDQTIASPAENYTRRDQRQDADYFRRLAEEETIAGFVVGLPVHLSGQESEKSREARAFGVWLQTETSLPIAYFDERFSSSQADEILSAGNLSKKQRAARRDMLAAQIMLTGFLESGSKNQNSPGSIE